MNIGQSESRNINALCSLLGYSRQAYYQYIRAVEKEVLQHDLLIQEVISIREQQKRLGTRKLLIKMRGFMSQHGIQIGRDAMFDLIEKNGLLVRRGKRRKPITTFSNHWLRKYDNLIIGFIPTGPNQLWVSDITYITLKNSFAYLSLVTDAFSRKIVGFYLSENLLTEGCIKALKMAIINNTNQSKLIHHSDRGAQYCSNNYVKMLNKNKVKISMTQSGNPRENSLAERVNGILKVELLLEQYNNFKQAKQAIITAISIYNHQRPHSSIDMLTPAEAHLKSGELKKHWKNYYEVKQGKEIIMK